MSVENFITKFKDQLEDSNIEITTKTDYVNAEYWDSLTAMVVKVMIEDDYNVNIEPERIRTFKNIQELYDFIVENSK